jgi:hypothetical protein
VSPVGPPVDGRNETPLERCDRNLAELMQEVRVAQTGVQVLFGFLLTVPFTVRFDEITSTERAVYFITLMLAGAAAMLLIAPTSQHRLLFRCGDKQRLVMVANRYAIAGLGAVAATMVGAVLLVSLLVIGNVGASLATAAAAFGCGWCWYVEPLRRRRTLDRASMSSSAQGGSDRRAATDTTGSAGSDVARVLKSRAPSRSAVQETPRTRRPGAA